MVAVQSFPGVQVVELPAAVRAIAGVSTSVTALLGRAPRGPVDRAVRVTSIADYDRVFGGLWFESPLGYMVHQYFRNGGIEALIVRLAPGATAATVSLAAAGAPAAMILAAADPGDWGETLRATVTVQGARFSLTILEVNPSLAASDPRRVLRREDFYDLGVGATDARRVDRVLAESSRLARCTQLSGGLPAVVTEAAFVTGGDGTAPVQADYTTGLTLLDRFDSVNMVSLAPPTRTGDVPVATWALAAAWCEGKRAMLLIDPPASWTNTATAAAKTDLTGVTSANAAMFYPRISISDPLREGRPLTLPPSSTIAGVYARTDAARGVWKAPAGNDAGLVGITSLVARVDDAASGALNPVGVNALRSFSDTGPVVWGARTAQGADTRASQWKYVPVRRLALYLESSLVEGTKWAVFEPNDERLWGQLRLNIGAFMNGLFRQGAFQGSKASDAYFVKCDAETTLPSDVNRGIVNVVVGFAPLKPAEFVVLQFQQILRAS